MFNTLANGVEQLINEVIELSYFMRGSCPYDDMMMRTSGERERIRSFIEKHITQERKNSMNPNY